MDFVKVINPGNTYTSIAKNEDQIEKFGYGRIIQDKTAPKDIYKVIRKMPHPSFWGVDLNIIENNNGDRYIVDNSAIIQSTKAEYLGEDYGIDLIATEYKPSTVRFKDSYNIEVDLVKKHKISNIKVRVGDVIRVVDKHAHGSDFNWIVTRLNSIGHDVIVGDLTSKIERYGYRFNQIEVVVPELELEPDDTPQFSRNEILEILKQDKTQEEMILDLMDHITN